MSDSDTTRQALANLLAKQEQEREDLAHQLLEDERDAAARLQGSINTEAGTALISALDAIDRQLRSDLRAGSVRAKTVTELPAWADVTFPRLDPDEVDAGKRPLVICIPRQFGDGHVEKLAYVIADVTDVVHGPGSRRRRDQQIADEAAHVAEVRRARAAEDAERAARR